MWRKLAKLYRLLRRGEGCGATPDGRICVGFIPWWPGTFYQARLAQELETQGIRVRGLELSLRSLICLLRGCDPHDAIHVHWPHGMYVHDYRRFPFVLLHLWLYRWLKNNVVWTVHELEFYETRYPWLDRIMVYSMMRIAKTLIVHSDHSRAVIRGRYRYRRRIALARHPSYIGCYPNDIGRECARAEMGLDAGTKAYVFLGHIKPYKGVEDLIEAFAAIADPCSRLIVAGKPLNEETARRICRLAACDARVTVHAQFLPDERLQVFLNAADVVVFPFRRIHTSGSVLLAMSFARPVIVPTVGALREDVDEQVGILFDPNDGASLGAALRRAQTQDLAAMGRAAYARIERRTWPEFGARQAQLYRQLKAADLGAC